MVSDIGHYRAWWHLRWIVVRKVQGVILTRGDIIGVGCENLIDALVGVPDEFDEVRIRTGCVQWRERQALDIFRSTLRSPSQGHHFQETCAEVSSQDWRRRWIGG